MTDDSTPRTLREAHEPVTVEAPRWVFDMVIATAELVAEQDEASDDLRRDCDSAAKILRTRLDRHDE